VRTSPTARTQARRRTPAHLPAPPTNRHRTEEETRRRRLPPRRAVVVEPSGALSVAALAFRAAAAGIADLDGPVVAVISGGNVDPERYRAYLEAPIPARG
jgi:hypothetical protein